MLKPDPTRRFKKDFKKYEHNKPVKKELETVLGFLLEKKKLPEERAFYGHVCANS